MLADIREACRRWSLWQPGERVCVALSGGCDSVALLHALHILAPEEGLTLSAAHVNHHLRGEESDGDEAFVRELCAALRVPLTVFDVDVRGERQPGESEELCARRLRYRALDALTADGVKVATAHTLSDQTETVLFRLARGTGVRGLCGIPPRREGYIRPLLLTPRAATEAYCRAQGLTWRDDSSNASDAYTRNYLRHRVLPPLREAFPGCEEAVGRLCSQMTSLDAMLNDMADTLLAAAQEGSGLRPAPLREAPAPVLTRALGRLVEEATGHCPDAAHVDALAALVTEGGRIPLAGGWQAVCDETLRLIPPETPPSYAIPLAPGRYEVPGFTLTVREGGSLPCVHNLLMFLTIDCDKLSDKAVLRPRQPGDRLHLNKRADKPLRKWMNEARLPVEQRDTWPVVADEEGVVALIGVGVAERVAPDENTQRFLTIEAEEKSCWNKTCKKSC